MTFFFFGTYTRESISGIDAKRTKQAEEIIKGFGGTLHSVHALLGGIDLVMIAELPGTLEAMQASIAVGQASGIKLTTAPAVAVADFDRIAEIALEKKGRARR